VKQKQDSMVVDMMKEMMWELKSFSERISKLEQWK
jgi:hypothetical protein